MPGKDFYDLDYIIEINEKRLDQYTSSYQKVLERFTNIILVYSALAIFLIQIVQDITSAEIHHWLMYAGFAAFCLLFLYSLYFTIRLIIPVEVAYLEMPKKYYDDYRLQYEQIHNSNPNKQAIVSDLLKASYINELESALTANNLVFREKTSFYYNALRYALLSALPYLLCLGFHISKKEDKVQKMQMVSSKIDSNLLKIDSMEKTADKSTTTLNNSSSAAITSNLPGINNSQVISSQPMMIKEGSSEISVKKR